MGAVQARWYREKGNEQFRTKHFEEAIDLYSKGLDCLAAHDTEDEEVAEDRYKLHLNRSQAYSSLGSWSEAESDARQALNVQHSGYKAYYLLGKALAKQGHYEEAISKLTRAESFASNQGDQGVIQNSLLEAKLLHWQHGAAAKRVVDESIRAKLKRGLALNREEKSRIEALIDEEKQRLSVTTIPPYLVCPINSTLMRRPVVLLPSGMTYEKEAINLYIASIRKKGAELLDPVTRESVSGAHIPNVALRDASQEFINQHPWAATDWLP
eukprot:Protomagalhaensia_sp_Gyna_25__3218@NODE_292_length_4028_cov_111_660065_g226_i0_p3_GENE_NODE_292_length_4028_cov_111_660065_g226_i0NODE_292_length_4028_cov_111_660065_g226_i0_p3_ORF_typecomplete_len269_score44_94Ubox/PF04564_15/4_6e14TPR_2/PF07719_17/0_013TPR_2/PF07719_17/0_11TPR_2/PF07719_17/8e06TPR_16/PF13432_6/1TPR_16/PF13432_6/1_9e09TPR_MalT/PF17874_1/3_7e11TPR_1/PF00515_28/4_3TPR_1/PF00515_28/2_5TPR_1/PF00515_28/0_00023ANAPC3/PF12895_7/1_3e02ANAPC3/PF12895_7/1_3e08TPR_15/PF13429_6/6e08TPR_19